VCLGTLQRHVIPFRPLLDGSSAVVAALLKRRWREAGGTTCRPDHSSSLRAHPRASHTSSTVSSAATLFSKAKQALSLVNMFRVIGVQAQQAETMAVAASVPGVPSAHVKAAEAAANKAFAAIQAADKEAAAVVAAAANSGAAADADAAAAAVAAQVADRRRFCPLAFSGYFLVTSRRHRRELCRQEVANGGYKESHTVDPKGHRSKRIANLFVRFQA